MSAFLAVLVLDCLREHQIAYIFQTKIPVGGGRSPLPDPPPFGPSAQTRPLASLDSVSLISFSEP